VLRDVDLNGEVRFQTRDAGSILQLQAHRNDKAELDRQFTITTAGQERTDTFKIRSTRPARRRSSP